MALRGKVLKRACDVLVVGAGPAGVAAALRAGALGARTVLVTRGAFGGMAANDGPVPVRTLAQAARLLREARQLGQYGIVSGTLRLDYRRLLARVDDVVSEVRRHSALRSQLDASGVEVHEHEGMARFTGPHEMETDRGTRFQAKRIVLCTGGVSRRLSVPGAELTATHSDAWALTEVPESMLVIGAGATGVQVASVFAAFGSRVQLFQQAARILTAEDEEVSALVAQAFRASGIEVHEGFGTIDRFERSAGGVRMQYSRDGARKSEEASLVVVAVGWSADTASLDLRAAGVETDARGFVRVDSRQRTSAPSVLAAGDVTGKLMLVPQALQAGFVAGTNALEGKEVELELTVAPLGSFTEPEYAQVGLTESQARVDHEVIVARASFGESTRPIIDGRTIGFCKLVVDRDRGEILGCHVVGERAVDICQVATLVIASKMKLSEFTRIPLSFPTYAGVLSLAAARAAFALGERALQEPQP